MVKVSDHLDKETSASVEVTPTGVKFGAKSRLVSAIDRLGGNLVEAINAPLEARTERARKVAEGEQRLIDAAVEYGIKQFGVSPEFAERAFNRHFRKLLKAQENSDAVLREAIEDLRENPPSDRQSADDRPIPEEFLESLDEYGKRASTDELRSRWGRVLAAEVRAPGTFSSKVLRVVDELDTATAELFGRICESRLGSSLPFCMIDGGELPFPTRAKLAVAGLIIEPGLAGQVRKFSEVSDRTGRELWLIANVDYAVAIDRPVLVSLPSGETAGKAVTSHSERPAMPCYLLTDVGEAIASILPDKQAATNARYAEKVAEQLGIEVIELHRQGKDYSFSRVIPAAAPPSSGGA